MRTLALQERVAAAFATRRLFSGYPALGVALALTVLASTAFARDADHTPLVAAAPPEGSSAWPRECSLKHRFCLRVGPGTSPNTVARVFRASERVWQTLTNVLGVPPPEGILGDPWEMLLVDKALVDPIDTGAKAFFAERDVRSRSDRGESFALVDRTTREGCPLEMALARSMARASLLREAPATDDATAASEAEALAGLATSCSDDGSTAVFQSEPERSLCDSPSASFERGAALFFRWLDARFGAEPGGLLVGLWSLAPTHSPWPATVWPASPTGFDVLRTSLHGALGKGSSFDDVVTQFAVARVAAYPAPPFGWHLPWPDRARRIAAPVPVAPTGASYILIDHAGAPAGAKLRLEAEWEDYGRMRWTVLKLDAQGRVQAEVPIPSLDRSAHTGMTVSALDEVDRLVVVATNVGSTDHPFEPSPAEWEAHAWLLTVAAE